MDKIKVSELLNEDRGWQPIDTVAENEIVLIRISNENIIFAETDDEIYYAEDIKFAKLVKGKWIIEPPYPAFDYSPLSNKSRLRKGSVVTHWCGYTDEELSNWGMRFDMIRSYDKLVIEVDDNHRQDVYKALMFGASAIASFTNDFQLDKNSEYREAYDILCDLQAYIDAEYGGVEYNE